MKCILRSLALVALGWTFAIGGHAQNLIVNGGFEEPGLLVPGSGLYLPDGSTAVSNWVSVDNVRNPSQANNFYSRAPYYGNPASEGQHFIYLDNHSVSSPTLNGIYQDFATIPGEGYEVLFDASTEISGGNPAALRASAGSTVVHYTLPNVNSLPLPPSPPYTFTGWSTYTFKFIANAATTRLQFFDEGLQTGGETPQGAASPLLDNVRVFTTENLVANGSFETPSISNSNWSILPTNALAPWQMDGDGFEIWADGMVANGWGPTYSVDGRQNLEVQGANNHAVWQSVPTTVGQWLCSRICG